MTALRAIILPIHLKQNSTPLLAIALAGIVTPMAEAAIITETTDYSNSAATPTVLGPFNPQGDQILGSLTTTTDQLDHFLVTGGAGTPLSIPFSFLHSSGFQGIGVQFYDDANFVGLLTFNSFFGTSGGATFNITVPSDGDYMVRVTGDSETAGGGSFTYSFGTVVPEPSASLLLAATAGVAALRRRRKGVERAS